MKFNLILILVSFLLLSVAAVFEVNFLSYKAPVPYSGWKSISLYDFKGLKKPGITLFGSEEFAFIETSREVRTIDNTTAEILTCFHPSRSYVFDREVRSRDLLQHELYHLHITEYCSRMLRKELLDSGQPFTSLKLEELNEKYSALEFSMQRKYDDESYHSYVLKEQKSWQTYIDSALAQLSSYSEPVVKLKAR